MAEPTGAVLVVIPTYNERDNLRPLLARLHRTVPGASVLVVDDASPDGTGDLAEELAAADPRIEVLHRTAKSGLGTAYLAAFAWAMERDYPVIVQMDADGSHPPEALPSMLEALADADVVMGSRYVPGGEVRNWPVHREWLSRGASLYSRLALGIPTRDVTAGYRAFRRQVLAELDLDSVASQGYCFQIDMTWRALQGGFRVVEVPITFTERERGKSKMSGAIVGEALWQVGRWGIRRMLGRPGPTTRTAPASDTDEPDAASQSAPKAVPTAASSAPAPQVPVDDDAVSDGPVRA
ncbi:polyprenol monophosphomannose synthase [Pseudonocardia sp. S2-4]|uniref:Polyprenol monophosphomannose synthase n=1 Tax=Pseudonocardia humida TaxID=2800819 RepID=A0ABT1AAT5_9PSEU|nr:polyprenol monophosphomannose synthase [Pseudonocardia humida]